MLPKAGFQLLPALKVSKEARLVGRKVCLILMPASDGEGGPLSKV